MMEDIENHDEITNKEKRKRDDLDQNIEGRNKRSNKEEDENSDLEITNKPEKDSTTDHSYAGTKNEKKRRKITINAVKSEYKLKQNKKDKKKDEEDTDPITPISINDGKKSFQCDNCGSPFITNPMIRGNRLKKSKHMPSPRRKMDPETKKILSLCNACGLAFGRVKKVKMKQSPPSLDDKQKYLDEGRLFAEELAKELGNEEAKRLYCSYYTKTPCGCIQRYIGNDKSTNRLESAQTLLQIMSKAKQYKSLKFKDDKQEKDTQDGNQQNEIKGNKKQKKNSSKRNIGLGNGHKKSKEFEKYVLEQRAWLKKKFGLCETGTKRVLLYSNNFLHKKLKTEPDKSCRVPRQKGLAALGKLVTIKDLPKEQCCVDNCVRMALTLQTLLQQWRDRSVSGQAEARRVIAEMLTPSGGSRTNCYKFVSWVTGCSLTTIGKVNEQMKKTGGNREPPEHGLKQWWKDHPKPKKEKLETKSVARSSAGSFTPETASGIFPTLVQSLGIIQAAANSSGLTAVIQGQQQSQQQQSQTIANNQANNATVITVTAGGYPQSFITIPGNTVTIPMNAVQMQNIQFQQQLQQPRIQFLQQQQAGQQQQNHQAVPLGGNQIPNINRQQQVTTPTMVSNATQQGQIVLAPVITDSVNDSCIPSMAIQQSTCQANNTQGGIHLPAQFVIAPTQGNHLLLPNNAPGIINFSSQSQHNESASSNVSSLSIGSGSSTTDFLSSESSLPITAPQLGQLIQQNSTSPIQVSFMSQS